MAENTEQVTVSLAVDLGNWGSGFAKAKNDLDNFEDKLKQTTQKTNKFDFSKFSDSVGKVTSKVSQHANRIGDSFLTAGLAIKTATVGVVGAVGAMGTKILETSADLQVVEAQYAQVFQGIEKQANESMENMSKAWNVVPERLKAPMSAFQSFFKATGQDAPKALKSTEKALTLVADASAFYDRSLEDTQESLKGFLMGNYENGDALGINTNLTKIATAYNKKYGGSFEDLSDSAQQDWLLEYIQDVYNASGVTGQATRESANWSNVLGNLQAKFKGLIGSIGKGFLTPVIDNLNKLTPVLNEVGKKIENFFNSAKGKEVIDSFSKALEVLVNAFIKMLKDVDINAIADTMKKFFDGFTNGDIVGTMQRIADSISDFVSKALELAKVIIPLIPTIVKLAPTLISLGLAFKTIGAVSTAVGALTSFASGIGAIVKAVQGGAILTKISSGFTAIGTALGALSAPVVIAIGAVIGLVGAFLIAYNKSEAFRTKVNEVFSFIGQFISQTWQSIKEVSATVWNEISTTVMTAVDTVASWIQTVWGQIKEFWNTNGQEISAVTSTIWEAIKTVVSTAMTFLADVIGNAWDTIKGVTSGAWTVISGLIQGAIGIITGIIQVFVGVFTGNWQKAFDGVKNIVSSGWNMIKSMFSGAMKAFGSIVQGGISNIISFFRAMPSKIANTIGSFGQTLFNSGAKIVQQIANGIRSAVHTVESAISSVTSKIRRFLPFSPAKEGPLRDLNKLNFGGTISEGIYNGKKAVTRAMDYLTTFPQLDNIGTLSMQSDISSQFKGQTFKGALGSNNTVIQTVVTLDGKEIARASAPYAQTELDLINQRNNRLYGY